MSITQSRLVLCDATTDCQQQLNTEESACCHVTDTNIAYVTQCITMRTVETLEAKPMGTGVTTINQYCTGAIKLASAAVAAVSLMAAY